MAQRPIVPATIRTEFGDVLDDPAFRDVGGVDRDLTYVPGFSDMRRARDLELAAVASGQKLARDAKLTPLPVNMRWVRRASTKGAPDGGKQIGSGNLGYRIVNKTQIGKEAWLTKIPPGATLEPDGAIVKGDCVLMVADGQTAARNAARKASATRSLTDAATAAAGGLIDLGTRKQGTDAFVKQEA